jgi:hypothetical protein
VYLGICIPLGNLRMIWLGLLVAVAVAILRLLITRISLPQRVGLRELAITSQLFPKGLAAAVLAGIPAELGIPGGVELRAFVYSALLVSIIWSAVWVPLIEKTRLGYALRRAVQVGATS